LPEIPAIAKNDSQTSLDTLIQQYDAMIRYYFKENPDNLNDDQYADRIRELKFLSKEGLLKSI